MLFRVWIGFLLIIFLLPAVRVAGQEVPTGKWWHRPQISQNLKLTKQEINRLDQLFANSRSSLVMYKKAVEREQFKLDSLLSRKNVKDAQVQKQFHHLEQARTQLADERLRFVMGVRKIVGSDRFQQLKRNYQRWGQ